VYLVIFGAIVGFTAYMYILKNSPPARASTYAYVNPVVAVILGWALAGEPLTLRTIIAAAIIVAAVIIITTYKSARRQAEKAQGRFAEADDHAATPRGNYAAKTTQRECVMEAGD
jgi:threonine/homoserine efflux transporter RhtA